VCVCTKSEMLMQKLLEEVEVEKFLNSSYCYRHCEHSRTIFFFDLSPPTNNIFCFSVSEFLMEGHIKGKLFEGMLLTTLGCFEGILSQLAPQGSNKGQGFITLKLMTSESSRLVHTLSLSLSLSLPSYKKCMTSLLSSTLTSRVVFNWGYFETEKR
jgi:hypothetical protein